MFSGIDGNERTGKRQCQARAKAKKNGNSPAAGAGIGARNTAKP